MLQVFCVSVITCFEHSLSNKRDAGFYVYGQLARFNHKLCVRCQIERCVPQDDDWTGLLSLHIVGQEVLLPDDFLHRLILTSKVEAALRKRAAAEVSNKKLYRSIFDELVVELQTESAVQPEVIISFSLRVHANMSL